MSKTKLDSASEQNILNMLMESSIISSDQMSKINATSSEIGKSKLETAFELNFTDENKILKILSSNYSLPVIDLKKIQRVIVPRHTGRVCSADPPGGKLGALLSFALL